MGSPDSHPETVGVPIALMDILLILIMTLCSMLAAAESSTVQVDEGQPTSAVRDPRIAGRAPDIIVSLRRSSSHEEPLTARTCQRGGDCTAITLPLPPSYLHAAPRAFEQALALATRDCAARPCTLALDLGGDITMNEAMPILSALQSLTRSAEAPRLKVAWLTTPPG